MSPEYRDDVVKELKFAAENDVDYVAASFVQQAADIYRMREILVEHDRAIPIIAKIENRAGLANLEEIVAAADGVMVARGDLGVELPLAEVPVFQKRIIRHCDQRQTGYHRYRNACVHGAKSQTHPSGSQRRGKRHSGRQFGSDAVGRQLWENTRWLR